jgi:membrane-bound lytic murein transglycosylase
MMCLYAYKRLVIQNLCKRSRYLEENPVFLFFSKKKNEKEEFSPSLQVGFSIVDLKLKELS